jgi:hypothetical protein
MPKAKTTPGSRTRHYNRTAQPSRASSVASDDDNSLTLAGPSTPSRSGLHQQTLLTTEQWYKSKNTQKGYASHVRGGKQFVKDWDAEHEEETEDPNSEEDEDGIEAGSSSLQSSPNSLRLGKVFDEIGENTPTALRLYTADKCEQLGRSFSVAEGTRSAFKLYFERYASFCSLTQLYSFFGECMGARVNSGDSIRKQINGKAILSSRMTTKLTMSLSKTAPSGRKRQLRLFLCFQKTWKLYSVILMVRLQRYDFR